jgi:methylated-DNA-[protein]-cysteine S-methyltransferase
VADAIFDSPIGPLYAYATADGLRRLEFVRGAGRVGPNQDTGSGFEDGNTEDRAIIQETQRQIAEYFDGDRRNFDLPLIIDGSDFQVRVWQAITRIPYGEVMSYADVAAAAGSPGAFRAAGSACGSNKLALVVPCHRVIAANRNIGGYGGSLPTKRTLLHLEGSLAGLRDAQTALAFV